MERIDINKALTSKDTGANETYPSMAGVTVKVDVKPIPVLANFIKSPVSALLDRRSVEGYKLSSYICNVRVNNSTKTTKYVTLTYKIGKTKYKIKSCEKITQDKKAVIIKEGNVTIIKSLFNRKVLKLNEIPKNVVESINSKIGIFNYEYREKLIAEKTDNIRRIRHKEQSFFKDLEL